MNVPHDMLDQILDALADRIADRVIERREREVYDSEHLPPDCRTRRAFAEACRSIPDATRRGRVWVLPRSSWEVHRMRRRGAAPAAPSVAATAPPGELESQADALLARSGLRVIRGAK